jgi:hypothetical protein
VTPEESSSPQHQRVEQPVSTGIDLKAGDEIL